jgi:hypothetical protein
MKKVIITAVLATCEIVGAVGADVKDAAEEVEQKANVDADAFSGTFIGLSVLGSQRRDVLEYKKIHNSVRCTTPVTPANATLMLRQVQLSLNRYLSTIAGDAGSPFLTDISYDAAGNITGYSAYGSLSGNINKSAHLAPGAGIALSYNRRVFSNKIIGVDVRCEFSPHYKRKNQTDYLKDAYEITGLGRTERRPDHFSPAISLKAGIILNNELYYIALGAKRTGVAFNTEIDAIKIKKITPTIAIGTALAKGDYVYSAELRHSLKVGKTCCSIYNNTTLGLGNTGRTNCTTVTTLDTRASSQETCISVTFARKIFSSH